MTTPPLVLGVRTTTLIALNTALVLLLTVCENAGAQPVPANPPEFSVQNAGRSHQTNSAPIPFDQIGAIAGKQYSGDGLVVLATEDGALLRCVFQRMNARATAEGLWITSTVSGAQGEPFRLVAHALGRGGQPPESLAKTGQVEVVDKSVRFVRPGLTEEYSVSMDGVRQDFIVERRPEGQGELRVELAMDGAKAEQFSDGVRLVLNDSGRKIVYGRLKAVDARGKELKTRMEVLAANQLAVNLDDAAADYPIRIDPTFSDDNWIGIGSFPGANGYVYAVAVDALGNFYIGGSFTAVGSVFATNLAKWDGSSWSALGLGVDNRVYDLKAVGGSLYVGGAFNLAGGSPANYVAKWNGGSWSALGSGLDGTVMAFAVLGSDLYVGGFFTMAGGISANYVAKWDGSSWSALGAGLNNWVYDLEVSGGDLCVGGQFTSAGGIAANRVARWDGSNWSKLGLGMNNAVNALAVSGGNLYAGGAFTIVTNTGGVAVMVNHIAKWDGSSWSALGFGVNDTVSALAVSESDLYVSGFFTISTNADGMAVTVNRIAKWDGTNWAALGMGVNDALRTLVVFGRNLYAGGWFTIAGGNAANYVTKWDGTNWSALGAGMNGAISTLVVSGDNLYAGGRFMLAGDSAAQYVAKWDGDGWSALGTGVNNYVLSLVVSGSDLYVGGAFTMAGGIAANRVARWDGSNWSMLGLGMNNAVNVLAVSGGNLYAGGAFAIVTNTGGVTVTVNRVAKWDGSSWSALGSGLNNYVNALAVTGGDLYVGGNFTYATNAGPTAVAANRVAKWDGSNWSALGSGVDNRVYALKLVGGSLYVGGAFTLAGGSPANYLAKWDGSGWSALGSGLNNYVNALLVTGSDLYVGGEFTTAGGKVSPYIARAGLQNALASILIITTNGSFGLSNGLFGFNLSGPANSNVVIQASTNLQFWTPLQTNVFGDSALYFYDPQPPTNRQRFYRAKLVP